MIQLIFGVLLFPLCALVAGGLAWVLHRREAAEDGSLYWGFMVPFVLLVVVFQGLGKTDTVRLKTDPVFRLQAELNAHPVYAALKQYLPDEYAHLDKALMADGVSGVSVPAMFLVARPWLAQVGTKRLGWADAQTRAAWAQITVDTLAELRGRSPDACFQAIAQTPEGVKVLSQGLSAANTKTFEATFVALIKSADQGIRNTARPAESAVSFDDAAKEWRAIMTAVTEEFGPEVTDVVAKKAFRDTPPELQSQVCAARIKQLGLILDQTVPMAGRLVDSAMR
jgi:hypothetical protein